MYIRTPVHPAPCLHSNFDNAYILRNSTTSLDIQDIHWPSRHSNPAQMLSYSPWLLNDFTRAERAFFTNRRSTQIVSAGYTVILLRGLSLNDGPTPLKRLRHATEAFDHRYWGFLLIPAS